MKLPTKMVDMEQHHHQQQRQRTRCHSVVSGRNRSRPPPPPSKTAAQWNILQIHLLGLLSLFCASFTAFGGVGVQAAKVGVAAKVGATAAGVGGSGGVGVGGLGLRNVPSNTSLRNIEDENGKQKNSQVKLCQYVTVC